MDMILYMVNLIVTITILQGKGSALDVYRDSYAVNGRIVDGVMSQRSCMNYCYYYLTTERCWAVDFNHKLKRCYVHSQEELCSELRQQDYSVHYRFVDCKHPPEPHGDSMDDTKEHLKTTPPPNKPPAIHTYETIYSETYINGGILVASIKSKDDCYIQCYNEPSCKAFDWDFINDQCFFHNEKTVCGQLVNKAGTLHMRLDYACDTYSPQTCQVTAIQELPQGFSRFGGTKIAEGVTYEYCIQMCQKEKDCNAVDWNIKERSCWKYMTDEFVLKRDCCLHARKVCNDSPLKGCSLQMMPGHRLRCYERCWFQQKLVDVWMGLADVQSIKET